RSLPRSILFPYTTLFRSRGLPGTGLPWARSTPWLRRPMVIPGLAQEFGLFRFDGVRSTRWQPPAGQELRDKNINSLLVTRDGTVARAACKAHRTKPVETHPFGSVLRFGLNPPCPWS